MGGDFSTPQKRAPGQSSGKSDRDDDEEDATLDCIFDEEAFLEILEAGDVDRKVCFGLFSSDDC